MTAKIKRKFQRANEIWSEEGLIELTRALVGFSHRKSLRKILPTTGYYTKAGIPARRRKLFALL